MDNIQFEEESIQSNSVSQNQSDEMGLISKMFVKMGIAKSQNSANIVMVIFSLLCFVGMYILLF